MLCDNCSNADKEYAECSIETPEIGGFPSYHLKFADISPNFQCGLYSEAK